MKISTSGKTCPKCESDALHRKFKSRWMRLIRVSKYYKCANCGHEIIVLFGYKLGQSITLYSLIGIVSIVCTIIVLWVVVLIAKDIGYNERNVKDFFKYFKVTEEEDPNQSWDESEWDKY
jgi:predicted RNA-binding Zn-ribbon protein involved in translation (DUF1610 family)